MHQLSLNEIGTTHEKKNLSEFQANTKILLKQKHWKLWIGHTDFCQKGQVLAASGKWTAGKTAGGRWQTWLKLCLTAQWAAYFALLRTAGLDSCRWCILLIITSVFNVVLFLQKTVKGIFSMVHLFQLKSSHTLTPLLFFFRIKFL